MLQYSLKMCFMWQTQAYHVTSHKTKKDYKFLIAASSGKMASWEHLLSVKTRPICAMMENLIAAFKWDLFSILAVRPDLGYSLDRNNWGGWETASNISAFHHNKRTSVPDKPVVPHAQVVAQWLMRWTTLWEGHEVKSQCCPCTWARSLTLKCSVV